MFRRVLVRIGFRGVILAAAGLGVAVAGCSSSSSSSSASAPAFLVPSSAPAQAATRTDPCTTTISNQTVGTVFVPAGQTCTLNNVTVHGSITDYGTLNLTTSAAIGGNVVAEQGSTLIESGPTTVTIEGNLTTNGPLKSSFTSDYVRGNVTAENTFNAWVTDTHVGGSVFFLNNGSGGLINGNTVAGNINCSGNATDPTNGGQPNTVHGHETGQCAGLH